MNNHKPVKRSMRALAIVLALWLAIGIAPASAARDRTPPTKPTNLHVTAVTPYSVSLAWNASSDASGSITYTVCCATTSSGTVSHPTTSFTFTTGVEPGWTHSFRVFATDSSGNKSGYSNTVTVSVPSDTTAPTAPTLSLTGVGSTFISLSWTPSIDNDPTLSYAIYANGSPFVGGMQAGGATSATLTGLSPATTYAFTVRASDSRNNQSAPSNPVTVTTAPADAGDTTPPTVPGNLTGYDQGSGEAALSWTQSTDNVDPQFSIRYEIFVNGTPEPWSDVIGYGSTIGFAVVDGLNTFEVFAVDSAGNRSASASITLCMNAVC